MQCASCLRSPNGCPVLLQLDRVEEEADMDFALDALALCRTRFVKFNDRSSAKLVEAARRAGCLDRAVEVLAESLRYVTMPSWLHGPLFVLWCLCVSVRMCVLPCCHYVLTRSITRYRLFPEPITFAKLAAYCSADGNTELVGKCLDAAVGAGVELHPRSVQKFTKAFIEAGDLDGALALFEHAG